MNNIRIGRRLQLAFGLMLLIMTFIAAIGIWRLLVLNGMSERQVHVDMPRALLAQRWEGSINLNWVRTASILVSDDSSYIEGLQKDMAATVATVNKTLKELEPLITDAKGKALMADVVQRRAAYSDARAKLMERRRAGQELGVAVERDLRPMAENYLAAVRSVEEHLAELAEQTAREASAIAVQGEWAMGIALAIGVLLGVVAAAWVTRSITTPLQAAVQAAGAIREGDLTTPVQVHGRDEAAALMQALSDMQQSLANIVATVRQNAEGVASASAQIAQGNNDLSARTEEQASALQQTAASMEQLSATVRQNADNAQQGNQLAQGASQVAREGGDVVSQVVETMKGINDSSRRIADIIGTIDGIAFQTNILALNAAVEAARAGEQGRGFAVVAGEVRTLAQRSAQAAKEIKDLIGTSVQRVEQGTAQVDRAGATMTEVVGAIARVTDIMGEISAASREQSSGVVQVGEAVTQMDRATQQNAALVEESAAAAESLKVQAQHLVQTVAVFKLAAQPAVARPQAGAAPASVAARPAPAAAVSLPRPPGAPAPAGIARIGVSAGAPTPASAPAPAVRKAEANAGVEWAAF